MLQPKLKVAVGDINRILLVFSVTLLIYANPALSQLGELMPEDIYVNLINLRRDLNALSNFNTFALKCASLVNIMKNIKILFEWFTSSKGDLVFLTGLTDLIQCKCQKLKNR